MGFCRRKLSDEASQPDRRRACQQRHYLLPERDQDSSVVGHQVDEFESRFITFNPSMWYNVEDLNVGYNFKFSYFFPPIA